MHDWQTPDCLYLNLLCSNLRLHLNVKSALTTFSFDICFKFIFYESLEGFTYYKKFIQVLLHIIVAGLTIQNSAFKPLLRIRIICMNYCLNFL